jgi:hypothetical protein
VDSTQDHERWIKDINETQHTEVNFPIIADKDRQVSMLFGMLDPAMRMPNACSRTRVASAKCGPICGTYMIHRCVAYDVPRLVYAGVVVG